MYDDNATDDAFVWNTCTGDSFDKQHNNNDILLHPGVLSEVVLVHSIHPNFFNDTINNSRGQLYTNDNPISNTQILNHALLRSSLRIKRGNIHNSIEHYNALRYKFR